MERAFAFTGVILRPSAPPPLGSAQCRQSDPLAFRRADWRLLQAPVAAADAACSFLSASISAAAAAFIAAQWQSGGRRRTSARASVACRLDRRSAAAALFASACVGATAEDAACAQDGQTLMRRGMKAFQQGQVAESIRLFDAAAEAGYPKDALWQRGLSLYYADRFSDGAQQFRDDVAKNPNDTEESIWAMLCEARTLGFEEARRQMLKVGFDFRNVMRSVYSLFRGEDEAGNLAALRKTAESGSGRDQFYAALYLGLYAEAKGDAAEAEKWIDRSVASPYGKGSGDYMAALARVHQQLRSGNEQTK